MINSRIYVEKKEIFNLEANELIEDFNKSLNLGISSLRVLNIYDLFNVEEDKLESYIESVFSEKVTDNYYYDIDLKDKVYFATEYLPGQFCARSHNAMQCLNIIDSGNNTVVKTGKLYIFEGISYKQLDLIKNYHINKIESREKDLSILSNNENVHVEEVKVVDNFITMSKQDLLQLLEDRGLAMNIEDLLFIQEYFIKENRNPFETEILLFDTYWSDHCRHTTFETKINSICVKKTAMNTIIKDIVEDYFDKREVVNGNLKNVSLMDMATICGKYQYKIGNLDDFEISEEVNACSIKVDIDNEEWLIMFKNETHNHPTEIEPYGGASTCIGGAIRDPLSGRAYVYQAMRISGSGNPFQNLEDTIVGKLPQKKISYVSALGNSSYGNQIGLTTAYVKEIVDFGYTAKHMEVGAVVGAVKYKDIKRETPIPGDIVLLLGGKTGRDGIGGATGSSKEQVETSLTKSSSEVQKGNAIEERKIQRLFRNPEVTKIIKKCNDFGAGGVAVSIGEIADSLDIFLDNVPLKYTGLNGTEIALSESQERMSIVISKDDLNTFLEFASMENVECVYVADVTDTNRLKMFWQDQTIVDISRDFLNTNGVLQEVDVTIDAKFSNKMFKKGFSTIEEMLVDDNIASTKGLSEMFDSSIGASTILMPLGGKNQLTPAAASVQKIPTTDSKCTILASGFNPHIANHSSFHSAMYAIIESITRVVVCGGDYNNIRFSFQEYFQKLGSDSTKWGEVAQALLGAIHIQSEFGLAAIGGKDSMSGTYKDINVPPTLISFAVCVANPKDIVSQEFKARGNNIYLLKHNMLENGMPNVVGLKENYDTVYRLIKEGKIVSANLIEHGIAEALCKMSFGNDIGVSVKTDLDLFEIDYGSMIIESEEELDAKNLVFLGKTTKDFTVNDKRYDLESLKKLWLLMYNDLYKLDTSVGFDDVSGNVCLNSNYSPKCVENPNVFIPVFPGTNCEYDIEIAFNKAGAKTNIWVFNNQSTKDIENSILEMKSQIDSCDILAISGGFSASDEPDGSGKYIANILNNPAIRESVESLLARDGLILGVCNGFQALIKCGLLPYGSYDKVVDDSPTLFRNKIGRHMSTIVETKVVNNKSPWLTSFKIGETHLVPISHGEGRFVMKDDELFKKGQVAFTYVNTNPNGSSYGIEGITSPCGKILGKMAHSERKGLYLYKNIPNIADQDIFINAVNYFRKGR